MLFGKLGGNPAEFKCRPYEDCLSEIAVTHSPRYLINMELAKEDTIFSKMNIPYNTLRTSPDAIEKVRDYYRKKAVASNRKEMPWWIGRQKEDSMQMNVRLWNDREYRNMYAEENKRLKTKMFILFPEVIKSDYRNVALWLCSRYSIILHNARDQFSASGQWNALNGKRLKFPLPHIIGEVLALAPGIKYLLQNPVLFREELIEFRPDLLNTDCYSIWLRGISNDIQDLRTRVDGMAYTLKELGGIPFGKWFEEGYTLSNI